MSYLTALVLVAYVAMGLPIPYEWRTIAPRSNVSTVEQEGSSNYVPKSKLFWMTILLALAIIPFVALLPILLAGFLSLSDAQLQLFKLSEIPRHRLYAEHISNLRTFTFTIVASLVVASTALGTILSMLLSRIFTSTGSVTSSALSPLLALLLCQLTPNAIPSLTLFELAGFFATPTWWIATLWMPFAWPLGWLLKTVSDFSSLSDGKMTDGMMSLPELIMWIKLHTNSANLGGELDDEWADRVCGEMQEELKKVLQREAEQQNN